MDQPQDRTECSPTRESSFQSRRKKRNHRGGKKKRQRKQSFASPSEEDVASVLETSEDRSHKQSTARSPLHRLQGRNSSNTSIESEALLDHREQKFMRPRRASTLQHNALGQSIHESPTSIRPQYTNPFTSQDDSRGHQLKRGYSGLSSAENLDQDADERTPMLPSSRPKSSGYGGQGMGSGTKMNRFVRNDSSSPDIKKGIPKSSNRDLPLPHPSQAPATYNVNYPPSVPGSPEMSPAHKPMSFGDILGRGEFPTDRGHFDADDTDEYRHDISRTTPDRRSLHGSSQQSLPERLERRPTVAVRAEEDVCFPAEDMSEITELADEDTTEREGTKFRPSQRRRRVKWPDLVVLDEWSRIEKEGRSEEQRAKRMVEPHLIGGRLRPTHSRNWHRVEEDAPYRFTYFNEEFPSTIHSQTISELVQPGGSFRELFIPDPPQLSDSSSEDDDEGFLPRDSYLHHTSNGLSGESRATTRQSSVIENLSPGSNVPEGRLSSARLATPSYGNKPGATNTTAIPELRLTPGENHKETAKDATAEPISSGTKSPEVTRERPKRYGDRPTWWLDVFSPSDAEMKVLAKAFGIHPLTAEDIMVQEAREKVELFRNYYFVNYRTFEQDMNNEDFLEPVNMYVVVFREGIISFHFSLTPHPANVRRRIRQLKDYLILSSDWISYAIIDDITDVFAPLIQTIEEEVDDIDDAILMLHSSPSDDTKDSTDEKRSEVGVKSAESGSDMLRRVGDCRKKVMGLYRLLGNKADVIKGFAKRCNEHWDVAPRSEIGLYLGDIQDHIVTMTGNLSHYEKILARSHGNYLAQINIRMNERQEQTADVLGKLTVLGTIVLPMNIITGLWGMNVWVPGQNAENNLMWFWCITAGLMVFGMGCFFMARTLYRIV